jgi:hypothetical protein
MEQQAVEQVWIAMIAIAITLAFAIAGMVIGGGWQRVRDQLRPLVWLCVAGLGVIAVTTLVLQGNAVATIGVVVLSAGAAAAVLLDRRLNRIATIGIIASGTIIGVALVIAGLILS